MLPVVVIAAIPLALLGDWRPWGNAMAIPVLGNPGFGQWLVIALVLIIVIDTVRGMIDDLRHGQVGVDVLAVVAILSTVAVAEYLSLIHIWYRGYESGVPLPGLAQLLVRVTGLLGVGRQLGELRTVMLG